MKQFAREEKEAKERILAAAKSEFAARGFQGARTATIAESAGCNKALIHYYFKNKESLYVEILERIIGVSEMNYDVPIFMGSVNLTCSQKIYILTYLLVMSHLRASDAEGNDIMLWEIAEGGDFLRKIHETYLTPRMKVIMKIIEEGIDNGEFETGYPQLILHGLTTMIISFQITHQRKIKPSMISEDSEDTIFSFCIEYIFRMLRPRNRSLDVPEVPAEVISYIDGMIKIMIDQGVSEKLVEALMDIITKR